MLPVAILVELRREPEAIAVLFVTEPGPAVLALEARKAGLFGTFAHAAPEILVGALETFQNDLTGVRVKFRELRQQRADFGDGLLLRAECEALGLVLADALDGPLVGRDALLQSAIVQLTQEFALPLQHCGLCRGRVELIGDAPVDGLHAFTIIGYNDNFKSEIATPLRFRASLSFGSGDEASQRGVDTGDALLVRGAGPRAALALLPRAGRRALSPCGAENF